MHLTIDFISRILKLTIAVFFKHPFNRKIKHMSKHYNIAEKCDGRSLTISYNPPRVDGKPAYDFASSHKNDINMMQKCCDAEMERYFSEGISPAPFYFARVAILARKAKDYAREIKICEQYLKVVDELQKNPKFDPRSPGIVASPHVAEFRKRLPKARMSLAKQHATSIG